MWHCAVLRVRWELSRVSGGYGEGETPLPFPNRAVKPLSADGTWPSRARESRTPPVFLHEPPHEGRLVVVVGRTGPGARGRYSSTVSTTSKTPATDSCSTNADTRSTRCVSAWSASPRQRWYSSLLMSNRPNEM